MSSKVGENYCTTPECCNWALKNQDKCGQHLELQPQQPERNLEDQGTTAAAKKTERAAQKVNLGSELILPKSFWSSNPDWSTLSYSHSTSPALQSSSSSAPTTSSSTSTTSSSTARTSSPVLASSSSSSSSAPTTSSSTSTTSSSTARTSSPVLASSSSSSSSAPTTSSSTSTTTSSTTPSYKSWNSQFSDERAMWAEMNRGHSGQRGDDFLSMTTRQSSSSSVPTTFTTSTTTSTPDTTSSSSSSSSSESRGAPLSRTPNIKSTDDFPPLVGRRPLSPRSTTTTSSSSSSTTTPPPSAAPSGELKLPPQPSIPAATPTRSGTTLPPPQGERLARTTDSQEHDFTWMGDLFETASVTRPPLTMSPSMPSTRPFGPPPPPSRKPDEKGDTRRLPPPPAKGAAAARTPIDTNQRRLIPADSPVATPIPERGGRPEEKGAKSRRRASTRSGESKREATDGKTAVSGPTAGPVVNKSICRRTWERFYAIHPCQDKWYITAAKAMLWLVTIATGVILLPLAIAAIWKLWDRCHSGNGAINPPDSTDDAANKKLSRARQIRTSTI